MENSEPIDEQKIKEVVERMKQLIDKGVSKREAKIQAFQEIYPMLPTRDYGTPLRETHQTLTEG